MRRVTFVFLAMALLCGRAARAADYSENPERSLLFGFDLGAGLDPASSARSPKAMGGGTPEAYDIAGFLFGIFAGYRFNEIAGLEAGWHQDRHAADKDWGGVAGYQIFHVAARLAVPTPLRLTPVLLVGPAAGTFFYGASDYGGTEDNSAWAVGGMAALATEFELGLGVVAALRVAYLPLYRWGMHLELVEEWYDGGWQSDTLDTKTFGDELVHVLWITAAIQFEWTFE
ncbi:MAG: outer membrane beta-barrel protein [Deltaproteobacteria bacterium]|nr:outer membrane beta-barrel protein [Deltaproteobacteria bacterium]